MSCCKHKRRDSNPGTAFAMNTLTWHWDAITSHLHGAVHRIRTCKSFPANSFQDRTLQPLGYFCICTICGPCRVRTYNLSFRRRMLYPIELHSEILAGTSGFEPEHAGVKVLCLTGLATSQYIIYGGQSRIWTCKSFPTNGFQDRFLTSLDIRHIFGASHGTRTRTRKSELPPQDSVSTKFHQERILCLDIADKP